MTQPSRPDNAGSNELGITTNHPFVINMHKLPLNTEMAAAELVSILATKGLEGTASAFANLSKTNEMLDDPKAIRSRLCLQVTVLEALMNRLILSAHGAEPENGVKYIAASLATHTALVKVLSALYETNRVVSDV